MSLNQSIQQAHDKDKKKANQEAGIVTVFIVAVIIFCFLIPIFNTNAQPEGQIASGVTECTQVCTNQ